MLAILLACAPARAGEVEATIRAYSADSVFAPNDYSTNTTAAPDVRRTQIHLAGTQELGDGYAADYELRYSFAYRATVQGGMRLARTSAGFEDQKIGIRHALGGDDGIFTQALRVSLVMPGGADRQVPALGSGQWAIEPTYFAGFDTGLWGLHVGADVGSRIFLDGGSAQIRTRVSLSAPVTQRLKLAVEVTWRRSLLFGAYRAPVDNGELNNFLRPGIEARYQLADGLQSVLAYQVYAAGMDGTAYRRVIAGLAITY